MTVFVVGSLYQITPERTEEVAMAWTEQQTQVYS